MNKKNRFYNIKFIFSAQHSNLTVFHFPVVSTTHGSTRNHFLLRPRIHHFVPSPSLVLSYLFPHFNIQRRYLEASIDYRLLESPALLLELHFFLTAFSLSILVLSTHPLGLLTYPATHHSFWRVPVFLLRYTHLIQLAPEFLLLSKLSAFDNTCQQLPTFPPDIHFPCLVSGSIPSHIIAPVFSTFQPATILFSSLFHRVVSIHIPSSSPFHLTSTSLLEF